MLVQGLGVEPGSPTQPDHDRIGARGLAVVLRGKQQFAAPELHLVEQAGVGVAGDQLIERGERLIGLARRLVGTRHLVQHLVVARVVRIRLEQQRIQPDRLDTHEVDVRQILVQVVELIALLVQITQAAHGLGTQVGISALQFQEPFVILHRLGGVGSRRGVLLHRYGGLADQVADGRRRSLCRICRGGAAAEPVQQPQPATDTDAPGRAAPSDRRAHFGAPAGGFAGSLAALSYMVASAKRACTS